MKTNDATIRRFAWLQTGFLMCMVAAIGYGLNQRSRTQTLPTYNRSPYVVVPFYNDARVIGDLQLSAVLEKLKPPARDSFPKVNHVDHAFRFWGIDAVFSDSHTMSGQEMREFLTDDRVFRSLSKPSSRSLLVPDTKGVAFRTQQGRESSSHVDHTLSTLAECGTPLDFLLMTAAGPRPLESAFTRALSTFHLNQPEYEWSAITFALYGVDQTNWYSSEGRKLNWDRVATRLMRQLPGQGCCYGGHRLFSLAALLQIDEKTRKEERQFFTTDMRERVTNYLQDSTGRLIQNQRADGSFDGAWPGRTILKDDKLSRIGQQLLSTGHALEWWAVAPDDVQPPREVVVRAGQWLTQTVLKLSDKQVRDNYTFLTHAGRALTLWRGTFPAKFHQKRSSDLQQRISQKPNTNQASQSQ